MAGPEAQTRPALAGLRYLSAVAAFAPAPAWAGAWIAPVGGQEIYTAAAGVRADRTYTESSAYFETPMGPRRSVLASPWVSQEQTEAGETWRGEAVVAVKAAIGPRAGRTAMAVQAGAVWRSDPEDGCGEGGAELRWLGGRSFGARGQGFINLEAAARGMEGGCGSVRFEASAGTRPNEDWLAMAQIFTDEPRGGDLAVQGQLTLVRFGRDGHGVQVGVRARLDGEDRAPALVLGLWRGRRS